MITLFSSSGLRSQCQVPPVSMKTSSPTPVESQDFGCRQSRHGPAAFKSEEVAKMTKIKPRKEPAVARNNGLRVRLAAFIFFRHTNGNPGFSRTDHTISEIGHMKPFPSSQPLFSEKCQRFAAVKIGILVSMC